MKHHIDDFIGKGMIFVNQLIYIEITHGKEELVLFYYYRKGCCKRPVNVAISQLGWRHAQKQEILFTLA